MRRLATVAAMALAVLGLAAGARAEIVHHETAQAAFGFNEIGVGLEGAEGNAEFVEAWAQFAGSVEGARILGRLDGNRDFEITIEVRPGSEFEDEGESLYGESVLFKYPNDDGQTRVTIFIRENDTGGVDNLAETIYHEMRHVELWLDGERSSEDEEDGHDRLHADKDSGIVRYKQEVGLLAEPAPVISTPISDELEAIARSDRYLSAVALDLGAVFEVTPEPELTINPASLEIDEYMFLPELIPEDQAAFDALVEEYISTFDECAPSADATICGGGPPPVTRPDDVLVGVKIGAAIDLSTAGSVGIFAGFDSDGDSSNNLAPRGPNDPYQSVDRWYEMIFDKTIETWDFNTWQVGPDGSTPELDSTSGAFGILEGDSAWFVIPEAELPFEDPRVRVAMIWFDGNPITGITALDVSGELPSDPLLGLDGSRVGGQVTGSATIDGGTVFGYGPAIAPTGGVLDAEFCLLDANGAPRVDQEAFATLGEPPDAATASHNSGTTDDTGCVRLPLAVNESAGESTLRFSVGFDAVTISPIDLLDLAESGAGSSRPTAPLRLLADIFGGVTLERRGTVNEYQDEPEDQVNPFYAAPIDQRDTSLPLGWDIILGDAFTVDSSVPPSFGDNLVRIEPANGMATGPSDYTFYSTLTMGSAVDDRQPLGTHWCSASVHVRHPDRPVTIPASVIDEDDPAANTNTWWSVWFGPEGEMFTTKTEVNPETRVAQSVDEHSTLAVVNGNDVTLMIPADGLLGADRIVMSASCTPLEFTDYGQHTRDVLVDTEIPASYFDPAWEYEELPIVDDTVREAVTPTLAPRDQPAAPQPQPPVIRSEPGARQALSEHSSDDGGVPTAVSVLVMALGLGAVGAGVWAFWKAGSSP